MYQVDNLAPIIDDKLNDSEDDDCVYNPFGNSWVTQRTLPALVGNRCLRQQSSEMESIIRLRIREEQHMQKCIESIARMKATMFMQRNTSTDIKNGIIELEEAFDFMLKYRKHWMFIEKNLGTKTAVKDKATQVSSENGRLHDQERVFYPHRKGEKTIDARSKSREEVNQRLKKTESPEEAATKEATNSDLTRCI
ncbi:hypothetical protein KM043_014318 [Ampulex compressa]|nr:hypothetical protein KM043_014318 [Ampulex compressa]